MRFFFSDESGGSKVMGQKLPLCQNLKDIKRKTLSVIKSFIFHDPFKLGIMSLQ